MTIARQLRYTLLCAVLLLVAPMLAIAQGPLDETKSRGLRFEQLTRATHISSSGMNLWAELSNNSGHRIVLKDAELQIKVDGRVITTITLRDKVVVRRRSDSEILFPLRFRSRGSFALNAIISRILANDIENMTISYRFRVGTWLIKRTFTEEDIVMSEFFNNFAVDLNMVTQLQDIINNN